MIDPKGLNEALTGGGRLVTFLHDNPDPDAIAAAWLLEHIGRSLGVEVQLVHGGALGRAENSTMVRLLNIPLAKGGGKGVRFSKSDRFALVDTQPGATNNSFPSDRDAHVVIDHHPRRPDLRAGFVDVREGDGCTTTLMLAYHQAFGLDVSPALATAAFYAIISETQDLEREATKADRDACHRLFPLVQLPVLGKIRHPPREREYYRTIARALQRAMMGKNTCICHIGAVPNAEMVAEVADFLVAMKQVTWCLVSGLHSDSIALSIRTSHPDGHADEVMRQITKGIGSGGGHDMMAGGTVPIGDMAQQQRLTDQVTERFVERLARRTPESLRPLLEEEPRDAVSAAAADDPQG